MSYNPRRPYEDDKPDNYMESDQDYTENNMELCIAYLDALGGKSTCRQCGRDIERVSDLWVHDNDITMDRGYTGAVEDVGDDSIFYTRNNRFENNTYHDRVDTHQFRWLNVYHSFEGWQAQGMDMNGAIFPL